MVPIRYLLCDNLAHFVVLSIACRSGLSASGRHGSNPDVSGERAASPPRPMRVTVHIPGVVVPGVDSDNDSDGVSSVSALSLESSLSASYARRATNTAMKLIQNGGKGVRAFPASALLPGAGFVVPTKVRCRGESCMVCVGRNTFNVALSFL